MKRVGIRLSCPGLLTHSSTLQLEDHSWLGHLLGLLVLFQIAPRPWLQERLDLSRRVFKLGGKAATLGLPVIIGVQANVWVNRDKK